MRRLPRDSVRRSNRARIELASLLLIHHLPIVLHAPALEKDHTLSQKKKIAKINPVTHGKRRIQNGMCPPNLPVENVLSTTKCTKWEDSVARFIQSEVKAENPGAR
jgi:hypothetical protein